jgi:hypothetical protein
MSKYEMPKMEVPTKFRKMTDKGVALSTAHMRNQFDIVSAQNKELCALAQEVANEATEPIKTGRVQGIQ